jgi:hypothetical protein
MRSFLVPVMAFVLCACASTAPGESTPSVQNAVYVVGEGMPKTEATTTADTQQSPDGMEQPSKLLRLYWFFAGR